MKNFFYLFIIISFGLHSQSLSPQVINSAGGTGSVGSGTNAIQIYYNIGEPIVTTVTNGTNILTQGFLQPDIVGKIGLSVTPLFSDESCLGKKDGKIKLTIKVLPQNTGTVLYKWTPQSVCPNDDCASLDSLAPGVYSVLIKALDITNSNIVLDSVAQTFTVTANTDPCQITVYSGFSPNGDGLNDTWIIQGIENFPNNKVNIYNRWGNALAKFTNYDNDKNVWKGEMPNGGIVPSGTYFYIMELNDGRGFKKGWVEVTGK